MTFTIEPMINLGVPDVWQDADEDVWYGRYGHGSCHVRRQGRNTGIKCQNNLVKYVLDNPDGENTPTICCQLYDLAVLANRPLSADAMTKFVARSNEILSILAK